MSEKNVQVIAWVLSIVAGAIAFIAWGDLYSWKLADLTLYQLFPLFGLLAFNLMWSHYIAAAVRVYSGAPKETLKSYFEKTSAIVLVSILLHPGLLIWQLWRDGAGLPPGSTLSFVQPTLKLSIIAGMIAWLLFIAYEFRRKFAERSWWKYVSYGSDLAMLLIFVHGLSLGSHLQEGWFRAIWLFYGVTLIAALFYLRTRPVDPPKTT